MIKGVHAMFFSTAAEETRAFLRDKLGLPCKDVGEGWLIFDFVEADMGCHPAEKSSHDVSFYCDDIEAEVAELSAKGVVFTRPIQDDGWGLTTCMRIPGDLEVMLYQPRYK